jgi:hypothetical protein
LFNLIVDGLSEGFSFELGKLWVALIGRPTFRRSVGIRVACLTSGIGSVDESFIVKVGTAWAGGPASRAA